MTLTVLAPTAARVLSGAAVGLSGGALRAMAGADVPATPSADEARRAAREELARPAYHARPGLLETLWSWLRENLDPAGLVPGVPGWLSVLIVALAAAGLLAMILRALTRVTGTRRGRLGSHPVFDADDRDSEELARAADDAAGHGDWLTAVIERYRAIIRSLDEHGLIEDHPGLTAHEAAQAAASALGALQVELVAAAGVFDSARYGDLLPTARQDEAMRDLAERVAAVGAERPHGAAASAPPSWATSPGGPR